MTKRWSSVFVTALLLCVLATLVLYQTAISIVTTWYNSETFTHGFFVIPVFFWFVWRKRQQLANYSPQSALTPVVLILAAGFVWLVATFVGVQVLQQLALVSILVFIVWACIGHQAARIIAFPLCFLFFAAPVGEELMPIMMELTAEYTVLAIRWTGIPVYKEGLYFSLPSGNWSVVEACSGIRYLLASLTLGSFYAYLNFDSYARRAIFIFLSILVPVVGNWIRAYLIVMIGHTSGMELATGADHLVYGWLFFGLIMFILFSLGYAMREQYSAPETDTAITEVGAMTANRKNSRLIAVVLLVIFSVAIWPGYRVFADLRSESNLAESISINFENSGEWEVTEPADLGWSPRYRGYDKEILSAYVSSNGTKINVNLLFYTQQTQGKELINSGNVLATSSDENWRIQSQTGHSVNVESNTITLEQSQLYSGELSRNLVIWRWNWIDGQNLVSALEGKLREAVVKLSLSGSASVAVILSVNSTDVDTEAQLHSFTLQVIPGILEQFNTH